MTHKHCAARIGGLLLAATVGVALVSPAHADLIAYDGFSYAADTAISGQGTNANWPTAGEKWYNGTTNASMETPGSDYNYHALAHSGNVLDFVGGFSPVYRMFGTTYSTAGNIYFLSFVMDVDTNPANSYAGLSLFNTADTAKQEQFFIGQDDFNKNWSMELSANSSRGVSSTPITPQHSVLLVLELNGITNQALLFVNPASLGGSAPVTPSATLSLAGNEFSFNEIRVASGSGQTMDADEFRLGTTFADVTPTDIPEPASWMTFGFALAALVVGKTYYDENNPG